MLKIEQFGYMLREHAILPSLGREGDAGYDMHAYTLRTYDRTTDAWNERLMSDGQTILKPRTKKVFGTGFHVFLPLGVRGRICSRSGLAAKYGIEAGAGLIDPNFVGEIGIVLYNHDDFNFVVNAGDRIAQICFEEYLLGDFRRQDTPPETARGNAWAGSTGLSAKAVIL